MYKVKKNKMITLYADHEDKHDNWVQEWSLTKAINPKWIDKWYFAETPSSAYIVDFSNYPLEADIEDTPLCTYLSFISRIARRHVNSYTLQISTKSSYYHVSLSECLDWALSIKGGYLQLGAYHSIVNESIIRVCHISQINRMIIEEITDIIATVKHEYESNK